jgi:galactokinase
MEIKISKYPIEQVDEFKKVISNLYGNDEEIIEHQLQRYLHLHKRLIEIGDYPDVHFFSTPGRIEIGGNHTDHNHGRVLAAAVNLDSIAAASKTEDNRVTIYSEGYPSHFLVELDQLEPQKEERGTTTAIIRGIAARLKQLGYKIGGFCSYISSNVLPGSGLSSSASIEILIAFIFNVLYNDSVIDKLELAKIGQFAENIFFYKPCGLMDQLACAMGGIASIDFNVPDNPQIQSVDFDFSKKNFSVIVVNTGGSHADLTDDYASIPKEMKAVAENFHHSYCRETSLQQVLNNVSNLRSTTGDRAILRAIHFFLENQRVEDQLKALETGNLSRFLHLVNASGNSSFKWLQNCYSTKDVSDQGLPLALVLTENYINYIGSGACRVHGGGFAGTILSFIPTEYQSDYINLMEKVFGEKSTLILSIRSHGVLHLNSSI